jgi:glycosyltransferase involved in cell wall biosynthesis
MIIKNISVVIPTYNRAHTIGRCLASVLGQTLPPREVIVIDDGSHDNTRSVVEAFDDSRIRYFRQDNSGANRARNHGIEKAGQPWIAFQDADDVWLPHKLETLSRAHALVTVKEGCEAFVAFSSFLTFDISSGKTSLKPPYTTRAPAVSLIRNPISETDLLVENLISTQTLLAHRDTLASTNGFDESLGRFQDWDLAIRLATLSPFVFVAEPLVVAEALPGSISRNYRKGIAAREALLSKYRELYDQYPTQLRASRRALFLRRLGSLLKV